MFADTHAHLTDAQFAGDLDAVLERARAAGVSRILTLGTDPASSEAAVELAARVPEVFAAVGIHPEYVTLAQESDLERIQELARRPKVVALGEIGLDYYWDPASAPLQQTWFERQLALAAELDLPVCIHDRNAHPQVLETLRAASQRVVWRPQVGRRRGVLHAFSGDAVMAQEAHALGFKVSFAGPLTFLNAKAAPEVARAIDLGEVLIETDAPYLTPHPWRGRRNEPAYVVRVAARLAELKGVTLEETARRTWANARALFGW